MLKQNYPVIFLTVKKGYSLKKIQAIINKVLGANSVSVHYSAANNKHSLVIGGLSGLTQKQLKAIYSPLKAISVKAIAYNMLGGLSVNGRARLFKQA